MMSLARKVERCEGMHVVKHLCRCDDTKNNGSEYACGDYITWAGEVLIKDFNAESAERGDESDDSFQDGHDND